jgi:multidrug efflux system outer membrane protein
MFLSGCAAGPNYREPQTKVDTAFANGSQTNLTTNAIAMEWWRGFTDDTLNRLTEHAVAANHDLRIATARVREARALRTTVVLDLVPTVTANGGYTRSVSSRDSNPVPLARDQRELALYDAGFDAIWEVDIFGRVRRSIQASTAEVAALEASRRDVLVTVTSEVARNYFELRGAQHQLDVARQNADNQRETLDITSAKLNAGRGTDLDVARAETQLNATLATIPPLEATIKQTIYRLSVLTGQQPTALDSELSAPAPLPALPTLVAVDNPKQLLRRRPDIRAAERALAAATARIGVATADLFPRVTFIGNVGVSAKDFSALSESGADTYSFGPRITWAALDLGRVRARIKAADARAEAELANYEGTVLLALEETEGALVEFGRAQTRRNYLRASAGAAERAEKLATQRYDSGVEDFLNVLDAQRTLLEIQDQLAQSETRTATALVAVYKALGGGWEIEKQPASK